MAITPLAKTLMRRRTSDLERLASQYKKNIEGMTGEYQTAFANYQKSAAEQLAPYEEAVRRYKEQDIPAFEQAKADYESRLDAFNQAMADWEANPTERINAKVSANRSGTTFFIDGKTYSSRNLPGDITVKSVGRRATDVEVYRDRPMPKMRGSAPKAPNAPERPAVAEFDSSPFEQKRAQLQQDYSREVSERKGARLNAVRGGRTLLKDA